MPDLSIADGFYLNQKTIGKTPAIKTEVPTDHIVVIDCSGSMYNELPLIRQQLKNKLPMLMRPNDTVSIIWFSGRKQFGVVVEAIVMNTAVDLSGVHRAIDNFLKPISLTGFVEPLQEVKRMADRLRKPGRALNLFFMSDGHDNQWRQDEILDGVRTLQSTVSSAAVVEYGFYCNRPLMVKMAEQMGASEVLAENFLQYEPIFETALTKKILGTRKVEVSLQTKPLHGFVFAIGAGEILAFAVDDQNMIMVPEGITDVFWLSETPSSSLQITPEICDGRVLTVVEEGLPTALYASLVPLTQRMLSNDIFRVLKALGDVRLIRQFANCFGKQAYSNFQSSVTECVFDSKRRLVDGYDPNEVPAEDAYTVLDLLDVLTGDDGNLFYPAHESFSYERIGRKAIEADQVLSEAEATRVGEIAARLSKTRNPAEVLKLQQELSGLVEHRKNLHFVADNPDAGYSLSALVLNEDRPNVSAQVRIPGKIDVSDELPTGMRFKTFFALANFPTSIVRNYTIIRDGILNVKVLPVSLTMETYRILRNAGMVDNVSWRADHIYEIDLTKLPLINRKMVKSVSAKTLFEKQYALLKAKSAQKVFSYYFDQHCPDAEAKGGIAQQYGAEAAEWLASLGIKDYGYSPKVQLAEATECYYGKELTVSVAGLSSLPTVKSVLDKIDAGKKLTQRETLMANSIADVKAFLSSPEYTWLSDENPAKKGLLKVWLTERKVDTVSCCRKLMKEIAKVKFSIIVGQGWFHEFASLDENTMTMHFDGSDVVCSANMNEIEIKV